jgi:hypothetical protein
MGEAKVVAKINLGLNKLLWNFKTTLKRRRHRPHFSLMGNCIRG